MRLLEVEMVEGGDFTPELKRKATRKRPDSVVSIDGENLRPYMLVVFEEVRRNTWADEETLI